jgi:glycosyltransferase involved in cell wall biosynthesis
VEKVFASFFKKKRFLTMTVPRRLLHVFPTFAVGGAQTRFAAIANHFGPAASHVIVPLDGRTECREKLSPDLDVRFAPPPPGLSTLAAIRHARAFLAESRPDMLITSNWGSMDWAIARLATGLPHLHTEDGFGPLEQDRQLPRRVLTRRCVLRFSQVVLPSRTLLSIATDIWRLPPSRLHYIPNGIDTVRFAGAAPAVLPPSEGAVIGTIAALRPEKNLTRLLHAFALLDRPVRLVIVGDGPQRNELETLAASLGIADRVLFAGHSAAPETWLAAFDIFALPSDTEQMPLSLLEAMAASLPVAATDVGDVRGMVAAENLPYVVPRDTAALSAALRALLAAPDLARDIGRANAATAQQRFSQERMFAAFGLLMGIGR